MISVAALAVAVLPTACDSAYADSHADHGSHQQNAGDDRDRTTGNDADGSGDGRQDDGDNNTRGDNNRDGDNGDNNGGDGADAGASDNRDGENAVDNGGGGRDDNAGDAGGDNAENPAPPQGGDNAADNAAGDNAADDAAGDDAAQDDNGLDVLGTDCSNSKLPPHDGFQLAPRCVSTAFGEVASEDKSPSLLITKAPDTVKAGEKFTLSVSTRNLIRDRFLGADAGGYYKESSFLNADGIQRGHFHTACRMLDSVDTAPDAAPDPDFFLATQDNGGGAAPDTVQITVTGMPRAGTAQCAVWAGDGSHRIPMMQRANQTPAFDAVRIEVN